MILCIIQLLLLVRMDTILYFIYNVFSAQSKIGIHWCVLPCFVNDAPFRSSFEMVLWCVLLLMQSIPHSVPFSLSLKMLWSVFHENCSILAQCLKNVTFFIILEVILTIRLDHLWDPAGALSPLSQETARSVSSPLYHLITLFFISFDEAHSEYRLLLLLCYCRCSTSRLCFGYIPPHPHHTQCVFSWVILQLYPKS